MKGGSLATAVFEPYARALMSLAQEHNLVEQFGAEVGSLVALLEGSPELEQFLENPLLEPAKKKAVLQQIASDQLHPYLRNFMMLLVDRRRVMFLQGICKQFQALLRELNQTVLAEVTSAVELNDGQKQAIRDKVTAMTGARQVDLQISLNPELIGGVIVKVGSQVIDSSLRGQLRRVSLKLLAG